MNCFSFTPETICHNTLGGGKTPFKYAFKQTITLQREYIIPKTYNFNLSSDGNRGILTVLYQLLFKMLPDISILHLGYRV